MPSRDRREAGRRVNEPVDTASEYGMRTPRVLSIDDSDLMHRLLRARLQLERIEIYCASSGEEGLQMALELKPDVILLDIELEGIDGFEVLQRLKEDARTRDIAVIFISATTDTMDRVRCLDLGAVDFISKPFDMAELKARLRSAIRAQLDGLTALWNRAFFDQRLATEVTQARRLGHPLSLILTDIDHFKSVNDRFGHPFGDEVLAYFATVLSSRRTADIACRYGGEEFAIILPGVAALGALEVAEDMRKGFESHTWRRHPDLVLTASFGIADLTMIDAAGTPQDLVARADLSLYGAKRSGRNRVSLEGVPLAA